VAPLAFTTTLTSAGDALISLTGELDLSATAPLEEEVERLASEDGVRRVVLDLRELEFMDSSGLRVLVTAHTRSEDHGPRFEIVRPRKGSEVAKILTIAGIDQTLHLVDEP
jgi:anti-sigma B factor antagonist